MRLAGVLLLFVVTTAAGYMKSMSLKSRVETADELLLFLTGYKMTLGRSVVPVYVLVERLARERKYIHLGFLEPWAAAMRSGDGPNAAFAAQPKGTLPPDLWSAFSRFCGEMGQSDRTAQTALCDAYAAVFAELREEYRQAYQEKGRLYRSLGLYAGAFLAVLLI